MSATRLVLCVVLAGAGGVAVSTQSDLDTLMQQVLLHRDDNWKKLQQYVLDERETTELRGPAQASLWGERRDYTWYVRDGFFVRSPLKVNGASVSEGDRRKYEADFLRRAQERDRKAQNGTDQRAPTAAAPSATDASRDLDGLIRQTQQPQFISSAYFLRFKFDQGRYALVGREKLDDREVLRIEYYPTNLFDEPQRERDRKQDNGDDTLQRLMNKTSKVTLWVEPTSQQIVKYTFDDLGWEFFPGQWLVRVSKVTASMTVGEPFPGVWLPRGLAMDVVLNMAVGPVELHYSLDYHDYRRPDVTSKVGIPGVR